MGIAAVAVLAVLGKDVFGLRLRTSWSCLLSRASCDCHLRDRQPSAVRRVRCGASDLHRRLGPARAQRASGTMTRSYFGIYSIEPGPNSRMLVHGTTLHGVQNLGSPERNRMETSYYAPRWGVGLAMNAAPALFGAGARVAVVGLGAGTLACYAQPTQRWTFYEIDPAVVRIARDPSRFTFLSGCAPGARIKIGDARF